VKGLEVCPLHPSAGTHPDFPAHASQLSKQAALRQRHTALLLRFLAQSFKTVLPISRNEDRNKSKGKNDLPEGCCMEHSWFPPLVWGLALILQVSN
jgi:hypothetical protein